MRYAFQIITDDCPGCGESLTEPGSVLMEGHKCHLEDGNVMQDSDSEMGEYLILEKDVAQVEVVCAACSADLCDYLGDEPQD